MRICIYERRETPCAKARLQSHLSVNGGAENARQKCVANPHINRVYLGAVRKGVERFFEEQLI